MSQSDKPVVAARHLRKAYRRGGWLERRRLVMALADASIDLAAASFTALCGPNGSGKSTFARCLAGAETPDSGDLEYAAAGPVWAHVQLIPQHPGASFAPRFTVAQVLEEPWKIAAKAGDSGELLQWVELPVACLATRAGELSGGQQARLALARALAALASGGRARLLILDETLSSLDLSLQAQMVNLLRWVCP